MILRNHDELVAECNGCGTELPGGTMEFREFVAYMQQQVGWWIHKEGDEWEHYCPDCMEE